MIGVVTHEGWKVEGDGESGLTVSEKKLVPLVRVSGASKPGELTHRPELAAIARRMNAARVGVNAGRTEIHGIFM
jgi:hypothetical protein